MLQHYVSYVWILLFGFGSRNPSFYLPFGNSSQRMRTMAIRATGDTLLLLSVFVLFNLPIFQRSFQLGLVPEGLQRRTFGYSLQAGYPACHPTDGVKMQEACYMWYAEYHKKTLQWVCNSTFSYLLCCMKFEGARVDLDGGNRRNNRAVADPKAHGPNPVRPWTCLPQQAKHR